MSIRSSLFFLSLTFTLGLGCSDDPAPSNNDAGNPTDIPRTDAGPTDLGGTVDTGNPTDAGAPTDTGSPTDAGSPADASDGGTPGCTLTRAFVTTSNFMMGGYAVGPIAPPSLGLVNTPSPDQDHVPVQSGCLVFNLLRGNDVLAVLDPTNIPAVRSRINLRPNPLVDSGTSYEANPYDVEVIAPNRAYVSQYALSRIAIVDPTRDGSAGITGFIDLTPVRAAGDMDTSGSPEAIDMVRVGNRVFVAMQNLSSFVPVANGSIAVIDPSNNTLVDADPAAAGTQPVSLTARNPTAMVATPGGRLVVASPGVLAFMPPQALDGAIEAIDASTLRPVGMRVTEAQLGGDLAGIVMLSDTRGWALVGRLAMGDAGASEVRAVEFDLSTGTVGATVFSTVATGGIALDPSGNVWVLDRSPARPGVRVFRPDRTEVTMMPLPTGLPPSGIAFVP